MDAIVAIVLRVLKLLRIDQAVLESIAEKARQYGYGIVDALVAAALAYILGLLNGQPDWVIGDPSIMARITDNATSPLGGIAIFVIMRIIARLLAKNGDDIAPSNRLAA